ncbi:MAG: glycine--tRNA ligase, partial [Candidatus Korarchaeota archaeon]|nr:glycine--tRNA ligase [Candidatus Korarchaeota archaeon]
LPDEELMRIVVENNIKCPKCGSTEWTGIKKFNLMFTIAVGAEADEPNAALRPETTQGSVVEFRKSYMVMRGKLPFILGQVGRVFRNEISPRRALIRMREFQQLEIHVFFDPNNPDEIYKEKLEPYMDYKIRFLRKEDRETGKIVEMTAREGLESGYTINHLITYWLVLYQKFFNEALGFPLERLRYRELIEGEKAHYALAHWDLEVYTEDLGWVELVNNAYRTDYDLSGHMKVSGNDLRVSGSDGKKFLPHLYEPSIGLDRVLFHELMLAYRKDEERVWLQLPRHLAPIEVAVFPLMKKGGMPEKAKEIYLNLLKEGFIVFYDESGTIGRRYRRMDEVGTPLCITVDYQTLEDDTVTMRDRDTMKQVRVRSSDLPSKIRKFLYEGVSIGDLRD